MSEPSQVTCPYCSGSINIPYGDSAQGDMRGECPGCKAAYHVLCWNLNGGCATLGCINFQKPNVNLVNVRQIIPVDKIIREIKQILRGNNREIELLAYYEEHKTFLERIQLPNDLTNVFESARFSKSREIEYLLFVADEKSCYSYYHANKVWIDKSSIIPRDLREKIYVMAKQYFSVHKLREALSSRDADEIMEVYERNKQYICASTEFLWADRMLVEEAEQNIAKAEFLQALTSGDLGRIVNSGDRCLEFGCELNPNELAQYNQAKQEHAVLQHLEDAIKQNDDYLVSHIWKNHSEQLKKFVIQSMRKKIQASVEKINTIQQLRLAKSANDFKKISEIYIPEMWLNCNLLTDPEKEYYEQMIQKNTSYQRVIQALEGNNLKEIVDTCNTHLSQINENDLTWSQRNVIKKTYSIYHYRERIQTALVQGNNDIVIQLYESAKNEGVNPIDFSGIVSPYQVYEMKKTRTLLKLLGDAEIAGDSLSEGAFESGVLLMNMENIELSESQKKNLAKKKLLIGKEFREMIHSASPNN